MNTKSSSPFDDTFIFRHAAILTDISITLSCLSCLFCPIQTAPYPINAALPEWVIWAPRQIGTPKVWSRMRLVVLLQNIGAAPSIHLCPIFILTLLLERSLHLCLIHRVAESTSIRFRHGLAALLRWLLAFIPPRQGCARALAGAELLTPTWRSAKLITAFWTNELCHRFILKNQGAPPTGGGCCCHTSTGFNQQEGHENKKSPESVCACVTL